MMNYKLHPTLKDRALTEVAVSIWNQDNVRRLASCDIYLSNDLDRAEVNAREKAELSTWVQYHARFGSLTRSQFQFSWTSYGTVDRENTAKSIIEDENVDTLTRYKYACAYCLEPSIRILWSELDKSAKESIKCFFEVEVRQGVNPFPAVNIHKDQALLFWSFTMDGETNGPTIDNNRVNFPNVEDITSSWYPFEGAVFGGNEIALKNLIQKLSHEEKERFIIRAAEYLAAFSNLRFTKLKRSFKMYYSNVQCLLLSSMNEKQQTEVFMKHAREILITFLEWPWQQFFISTADRVWEYLSPKDFLFLLYQLLNPDYLRVYEDYNYQGIFQEFWNHSSPSHKKYVLDGPVHQMLLLTFLAGQKENILLMMRHATCEQSERILRTCTKLCRHLIISENIYILKFLLWKCIPPNSESKVLELNAGFVPFTGTDMATKRREMINLSHFVVKFISSLEKRTLEEENEIPLKKTCVQNKRDEPSG